jgi:hypothetical protein
MRKWLVTVAVLGVYIAPLGADITVKQRITVEGGAAAMMPADALPTITMRIKGTKARTDIEAGGQTVTAITDLELKQVIMLMPGSTVAQMITPQSVAAGGAPLAMPEMSVSLKPTGKSQTIEGMSCDEHAFTMTLNMASALGQGQLAPEAAAAMKDVNMAMNGSIWIAKSAPGAAEWMAFNKAALDSKLLSAISGVGSQPGMDKLLEASATAAGIPYLTEMTMRVEGSGPMVEAMKQMGDMKMTQKISAVSTDPIADDLFKLPAGYTVEKK